MARDDMNIMIGGEAGQGLVTIGQLLSKVLVRSGYYIVVTQSYLSRVRGGHNTFTIRAATHPLHGPREGVDLMVALNQETLDLHQEELSPHARVIADTGLACGQAPCLNVPYGDLADSRYLNTVALGVAGGMLGLDGDMLSKALAEQLHKLDDGIIKENQAALARALEWLHENEARPEPLAPATLAGGRLMLNGNEAIGLGALAGGLKFLSFYPMTPSTSIALTVIASAEKMGLVCEQAEDEIAAVNMAIGASYAGAPSMVTTSGGGYALMTEGLSLSGMTETPLVVALVMRPGPATGLPTRTEQGDLNFALHGGHGEFARAILTPGSVEQCFGAGHRALSLAQDFQTPVFILSDQFMADSYRSVEPFDLSALTPVKTDAVQAGADYLRYAVAEGGVSPRTLPRAGGGLVVVDSDEHTPDGHITEDLKVRVEMNDKRLAKEQGLRQAVEPPRFHGPEDAELLLVCWGSTLGPVAEAAQRLNDEGRRAAWCHFSQVWPLEPAGFLRRLVQAGQVVMVEANATGQFAGLIKRETGFSAHRVITRYDGLNFTPEYILRQLAS